MSLFTSSFSSNASVTHKNYAFLFVAALVLALTSIGLVNLLIDPNGRFHWVNIEGFNRVKIAVKHNGRQDKTSTLLVCPYDSFILGTSRAETGLNPDSFPDEYGRVYNAALKATSFYETARMLNFILEHQDPKAIFIGLDFLAFNSARVTFDDFERSILTDNQPVLSIPPYLLSWRTFSDSVQTIQYNRHHSNVPCTKTGLHKTDPNSRVSHLNAFNSMLMRFENNPQLYADHVISNAYMNLLEESLDTIVANNIEAFIFISPLHSAHINLMHRMGLLTNFHDWKQELLKIVATVNKRHGVALTLWDFAGYNHVTMEPVPVVDSIPEMRWYRDSSHYREATGNLIIQKLLGDKDAPQDFGVRLSLDRIESHLEQERETALRKQGQPLFVTRKH